MSKGYHRLGAETPWDNRLAYPLPVHKGAIMDAPTARADEALAVMEVAALTAEAPVGPTDIGPPKMTRDQATSSGFTGNSCAECGSMQMVRNGTCEKCNSCGATTGCS